MEIIVGIFAAVVLFRTSDRVCVYMYIMVRIRGFSRGLARVPGSKATRSGPRSGSVGARSVSDAVRAPEQR